MTLVALAVAAAGPASAEAQTAAPDYAATVLATPGLRGYWRLEETS